MNKINNYIKNNLNKIISIFIIISPILDLLVSISINVFHHSINIGIVFRMLFMLFIYYVSVIIYQKKKNLIYIFLCITYLIIYLTVQYNSTIMSNLHGFMRTFYFPILLLGFYSIKDKIKIENKTLIITTIIYILLIFIPVITHTGFNSYSVAKLGSTGWFNSTNEISGILSILMPIIIVWLINKDKRILKIITAIIFLFVISEVGTKTPILSLLIALLASFIFIVVNCIKKKNYKVIGALLIALVVISISGRILIPKTNFYKNIVIHAKYLKLNSPKDIFTNEYIFDHFIFSQRISFLENTDIRYDKVKTSKKIFGMGYVNKNNIEYKEIEMDYYDIWYNHGIVGFILFFSIYLYILVDIFNKLPNKLDYKKYMTYISLLLILILSLFSGHIITTPSVSLIAIIILMLLTSTERKRYNRKKLNNKKY